MNIKELLIKHEGLELHPYKCTAGKLSIGVGRNLEGKGLSREEAMYLLDNDIAECITDLKDSFFPGKFLGFPESIQSVLVNMRFQLGHTGLSRFKKMLAAFEEGDYAEASRQMADSRWYSQVPNRAMELIGIVQGAIS